MRVRFSHPDLKLSNVSELNIRFSLQIVEMDALIFLRHPTLTVRNQRQFDLFHPSPKALQPYSETLTATSFDPEPGP